MRPDEETSPEPSGESRVEVIRKALREVVDPELGINIVDLGLVYRIDMRDDEVSVDMTMTTRACPMTAHLKSMAESAIFQNVPGVQTVDIRLVWEPVWSPDMISVEARRTLGG